MAWPLADIVVGADRTHPPPPLPTLRPFPGRIASTRSSHHPRLGPGHTGGDQAGATKTATTRTTTSSQPTSHLEVLIRRSNFLFISLKLTHHLLRRRETIRKQRIESEQRRRDELRDGYARLKDTLPASNQKSSKVSLLDRGLSISLLLHILLLTIVQQLDTLGISRPSRSSWNSDSNPPKRRFTDFATSTRR